MENMQVRICCCVSHRSTLVRSFLDCCFLSDVTGVQKRVVILCRHVVALPTILHDQRRRHTRKDVHEIFSGRVQVWRRVRDRVDEPPGRSGKAPRAMLRISWIECCAGFVGCVCECPKDRASRRADRVMAKRPQCGDHVEMLVERAKQTFVPN